MEKATQKSRRRAKNLCCWSLQRDLEIKLNFWSSSLDTAIVLCNIDTVCSWWQVVKNWVLLLCFSNHLKVDWKSLLSLTSFAISEKLNLTMTKKKKKGSIKDWNKERKRGFSNIHSTWSARKNGGGFLLAFLLHHCVWSLIKAMNLLQKLSSSFFLLSLPPWPSTKPLFMQKFFNFLLKFSKWWLTIKAVLPYRMMPRIPAHV